MLQEYEALFVRVDASFRAKKFPKLKTLFKGAVNNILNLSNLLIRKSLLKENLYNYSDKDEKNKFFLPEEKAFLDNERPRVIYDRIKALIDALDYQTANLLDDIDSMSIEYIENTHKILSYFSFHNLNSHAVGINTRALSEMTNRILNSKDQILRRIVQDNLKLLSDNFRKIQSIIDEIARYKKEKYKALIRLKVFPFLPEEAFSEKFFRENATEFLKKVNKFMSINIEGIPFNKYWIAESIKACYTTNSKQALERLKSAFLPSIQKDTSSIKVRSPREKLLFIIEYIASSGAKLEEIYFRFDKNLKLLHNRKRTFFEQVVEVFRKALNSSMQEDIFNVEYINPSDKRIQNDIVNIHDFMASIKKKIILFKELLKLNSSVHEKVKRGTEEALYKFMEDTYFDFLLTKERLIGINGEIRLRMPRKNRSVLKEITPPIEKLDELLKKIGELRRKYVMEQDSAFLKGKKDKGTSKN